MEGVAVARMRQTYIRLDEDTLNVIDRLAESQFGRIDRVKVIRALINIGLREVLKDMGKLEQEVNSVEQ